MRKGMGLGLLVAGLVLSGVLIVNHGAFGVARDVAAIGWGLLLVVLIHAVQILLCGLGWHAVLARRDAPPAYSFIWGRWIREAINSMLPLTQIGGDIIGARLLTFRGLRGGMAGASVVVDLTMEVCSQLVFTLIGLALILIGGHHHRAVHWTLIGLLVAVPSVAAFLTAQRYGMFRLVERIFGKLAARWPTLQAGALDGLHEGIQAIYTNPRALLMAGNLHLLSWLAGAAEVWLILTFIGAPVTIQQALIIESLGQAIRSAAFMVPGGFGVQEGGYLLLAALFGLTPETGLALSLIKRLRELIIGGPGLLAWQLSEGRRLWNAPAVRSEANSAD